MFSLRIIGSKTGLQKYKIDVILDLIFINYYTWIIFTKY